MEVDVGNFKVEVKQKNGNVGHVMTWARNVQAAKESVKRLGFKIKSIVKVG